MAIPTTFTFIKSTPYSVVYQINGGVGAGALDFDPTMKANMVAGPLKAELTARNGHLDQLNLNLDSARVRLYFVTAIDATMVNPTSNTIVWTTTGLSATLPAVDGGNGVFIEIRFMHSTKR